MRRIGIAVLALAVVAVLASPAVAQDKPRRPGQGFGFGGGPGGQALLLRQESVQKELNLTEDQIKKVADLKTPNFRDFQGLDREEIRKRMDEANKANEKLVAEILKPEQTKRLKQIGWQRAGANAINDPEVATALAFTDEQKQKVEAIQKDGQRAMREIFGQGGGKPDEEARKKMEDFRKGQNEKLMNVLTAEQKTKFKDLLGPEFKGEIRFGKPGGN